VDEAQEWSVNQSVAGVFETFFSSGEWHKDAGYRLNTPTLSAPPSYQGSGWAQRCPETLARHERRPEGGGSMLIRGFPGLGGALGFFFQGFKVWIAQPLMPLFGIIAPPHFRLLKEAYQADDPKRLAQGSQTRLAHLCERHGL
jgi:hypothetical protein